MWDIIREAPVGQLIRFVSRNRLLQHAEENTDFELPPQYLSELRNSEKPPTTSHDPDDSSDTVPEVPGVMNASDPRQPQTSMHDIEGLRRVATASTTHTAPYSNERMRAERDLNLERTKSIPIVPQKTSDGIILVDWYATDDPANPQNWSSFKKGFIVFILCFYTFTVYCAGPIYAASVEGIIPHFRISPVASSLGLSLYVLAYGIGDLLFSPLTEIPVIGRNPVYYLTFVVYWGLSFPTAVVNNFGGLLALRFWMGFFGSPALANGGATIGDMFSLIYIPYGLSMWVLSAWAGPAFGPVIGGFAAMAKGWRWPLWEVVWLSSPILLVLLLFMPETSASTILLQRACRLRKLTGDSRLQAQSEIDQRNMSASNILFSALIRPMEIMLKDPSIFFVNVYTGYFYGVLYTFFEVFPLVFPPIYGFNLGDRLGIPLVLHRCPRRSFPLLRLSTFLHGS